MSYKGNNRFKPKNKITNKKMRDKITQKFLKFGKKTLFAKLLIKIQ